MLRQLRSILVSDEELADLVLARYRQHSAAGLDGLLAYSAVFDCSGSA